MNLSRSISTIRLPGLGALVVMILAAAGVVQITVLVSMSLYRHHAWTLEAGGARDRIAALEREVDDLSTGVARLSNDASYLETLARRQGFVRKGERVIVPGSGAAVGGP